MYIVTGGAGMIGSALIWKLNTLGIRDILVVDNLGSSEKWKNLVNKRFSVYMHRDEFLNRVKSNDMPGNIEAIVHMGACSSTTERDADFLMRNNVEYSKSLCLFAEAHNIRFIHASSAATYGDGQKGFSDETSEKNLGSLRPLNMYGYSKHLFDFWAFETGRFTNLAALKFFNVYGPNEQHKENMRSVVNKAFHEISGTGEMRLFKSTDPAYCNGGQMRDFVYVKDCAEVIWWLIENPSVNGLFNLGTGTARTWNDLAKAVFTAMDRPANIRYVDMPEALAGKYQNYTQANMKKLAAAGCPVAFTSLEEGVLDYVRHYLASPDPHL